jgi:DNA-binding LacI/PurR family transcriptional regulator
VAARFVETRLNYAAGVAAGQDLVVNELAPETGIISTNDWLAVGLRVGLSHHSNSAFRRLPIISFDGLPLTADPTLRIKSLKVPLEQIARDAVSEILRLARSPISIGRSISYPLLDP